MASPESSYAGFCYAMCAVTMLWSAYHCTRDPILTQCKLLPEPTLYSNICRARSLELHGMPCVTGRIRTIVLRALYAVSGTDYAVSSTAMCACGTDSPLGSSAIQACFATNCRLVEPVPSYALSQYRTSHSECVAGPLYLLCVRWY
eukprot:560608-Rhodomonas_salina.6